MTLATKSSSDVERLLVDMLNVGTSDEDRFDAPKMYEFFGIAPDALKMFDDCDIVWDEPEEYDPFDFAEGEIDQVGCHLIGNRVSIVGSVPWMGGRTLSKVLGTVGKIAGRAV